MSTSYIDCQDPCIDPHCRDVEEYGIGLHCHHKHRDPHTKAVQDAFTTRNARRDQAIEWLTDNIGDLKILLKYFVK